MSARQELTVYIDTLGLRVRNAVTNGTLDASELPLVCLRGHLLKIYLQTSTDGGATWSARAVPTGSVLTAMLKLQGPTGAPIGDALVTAQGSGVWNITADWASISLSDGRVCVRLDCNTDELAAAVLAEGGDLTAVLEIHWKETGALPVTLLRQPVRVLKPVDEGDEGAPTPATPTYYTAAQVDALIAHVLRIADGKRIVVDADGNIGTEDVA